MNRKQTVLLTAGLGVLALVGVALLFGSAAITAQNEIGPKPTFVPADGLTPAPTPPDGRQVAILTLVIESDPEGRLKGVQLERGRIINSYAPNVAERPGEWTVEVVGERSLRFGIEDPRRLHVYGGEDAQRDMAHTSEMQASAVVDLVVPLWNLDADLQAKEIRILDQEGNVVFVTEVDRERWSREQ
ncbi:MAG: hypothetical protein HPY64_12030 [Anaerolineae bacterium]|nr:hypothetical protein [Anaerolineae bacterium]